MRTTPARISTTIFPPVTTVPSTSDLCWLRYFTTLSESFCRLPVRRWNGGPASQD